MNINSMKYIFEGGPGVKNVMQDRRKKNVFKKIFMGVNSTEQDESKLSTV